MTTKAQYLIVDSNNTNRYCTMRVQVCYAPSFRGTPIRELHRSVEHIGLSFLHNSYIDTHFAWGEPEFDRTRCNPDIDGYSSDIVYALQLIAETAFQAKPSLTPQFSISGSATIDPKTFGLDPVSNLDTKLKALATSGFFKLGEKVFFAVSSEQDPSFINQFLNNQPTFQNNRSTWIEISSPSENSRIIQNFDQDTNLSKTIHIVFCQNLICAATRLFGLDNETPLRSVINVLSSSGSPSTTTNPNPTVSLGPSPAASAMLNAYPPGLRAEWGQCAIDGAIEIIRFPTPGPEKCYGGIGRAQIHVNLHRDQEWPICFGHYQSMEIMCTSLGTWLNQRNHPGRIGILYRPLLEYNMDRRELNIEVANSDYFTVRTITEISRNGTTFPFERCWPTSGENFPPNSVPYHLSAQGVVFCYDKTRNTTFLILTCPSVRNSTIMPGCGATIAEQMHVANPQATSHRPWWSNFTPTPMNYGENQQDLHIQDTLIRGLREELGLNASDYNQDPKLLNVCLEQDMYFMTFIFIVEASLTLEELYSAFLNRTDTEIGRIAAYPVEGPNLNSGTEIENLLRNPTFNFGQFEILGQNQQRTDYMTCWHPSSRMRIYVASRHMFNDKMIQSHVNVNSYRETT